MTRVRVQTLEETGSTGDVFVRDTSSATGGAWAAVSTTELGGDITTAGKAILDDADAAAQRVTLGVPEPYIVGLAGPGTAGASYGLPGELVGVNGLGTVALTANQLGGQFFTAIADLTITSVALEPTVAGTAGSLGEVALYAATRSNTDGSYTVGSRIASFGTVSIATTGGKTIGSLSQAITRGTAYFIGVAVSANVTLRSHAYACVGQRNWRGDNLNCNRTAYYTAGTSYPAPSGAPTLTAQSLNAANFQNIVGLSW